MILHEKYLCTELPVTGAHKTSNKGRREYFKKEVLWIKWRRVLKVAWSPEKEKSRAHSRKFVFVLRNAWRPNSVVIRGVTIGSIISRGVTEGGGSRMPSITPSLTLTPHTWHWHCVSISAGQLACTAVSGQDTMPAAASHAEIFLEISHIYIIIDNRTQ